LRLENCANACFKMAPPGIPVSESVFATAALSVACSCRALQYA
jgi:hypothetical protein